MTENSLPLGGLSRDQLMKETFSLMAAAEQVALFAAKSNDIPADSSEVYAAALAHIAEGFVAKTPRLIQGADALFLQLQQADPSLPDNESSNPQLEFALERGICALLVGEVGDCRTWLGLEDENSPYANPAVVNFVKSYSEEGEEMDSLPGLCKLLEGWLAEIVFPRFRDTAAIRVKLHDYFDDPGVLGYLEGLEKGRGSQLAAAAAIVHIRAEAGAAFDNVKANLKRFYAMGRITESSASSDNALSNVVALGRRIDGDAPALNVNRGAYPTGFEGKDWEGNEIVQEAEYTCKENNLPATISGRGGSKFLQNAAGLAFGALVLAGLRYLPAHNRMTPVCNSAGISSPCCIFTGSACLW